MWHLHKLLAHFFCHTLSPMKQCQTRQTYIWIERITTFKYCYILILYLNTYTNLLGSFNFGHTNGPPPSPSQASTFSSPLNKQIKTYVETKNQNTLQKKVVSSPCTIKAFMQQKTSSKKSWSRIILSNSELSLAFLVINHWQLYLLH